MEFRSVGRYEKINLQRAVSEELAEDTPGPEQRAFKATPAGRRGRRLASVAEIIVIEGFHPLCPNWWLQVAKGHSAHEKHALPPSLTITKVNRR
jgi:hypothetical protein